MPENRPYLLDESLAFDIASIGFHEWAKHVETSFQPYYDASINNFLLSLAAVTYAASEKLNEDESEDNLNELLPILFISSPAIVRELNNIYKHFGGKKHVTACLQHVPQSILQEIAKLSTPTAHYYEQKARSLQTEEQQKAQKLGKNLTETDKQKLLQKGGKLNTQLSRRFAYSELTAVYNFTLQQKAQHIYASGKNVQKMWKSRGDHRVRPTHRTADGQIRTIFELFSVGRGQGMYPGDRKFPYEETSMCRCRMEIMEET